MFFPLTQIRLPSIRIPRLYFKRSFFTVGLKALFAASASSFQPEREISFYIRTASRCLSQEHYQASVPSVCNQKEKHLPLQGSVTDA
jgi:hypothetical protein